MKATEQTDPLMIRGDRLLFALRVLWRLNRPVWPVGAEWPWEAHGLAQPSDDAHELRRMLDAIMSKVAVPERELNEEIVKRATIWLSRDTGMMHPSHPSNFREAHDALSVMRAVLHNSPQALQARFDARPLITYAMREVGVLNEAQFERFFRIIAAGELTEADFKEVK